MVLLPNISKKEEKIYMKDFKRKKVSGH